MPPIINPNIMLTKFSISLFYHRKKKDVGIEPTARGFRPFSRSEDMENPFVIGVLLDDQARVLGNRLHELLNFREFVENLRNRQFADRRLKENAIKKKTEKKTTQIQTQL